MGDGAKGYNGWADYETWCVHLWLTNEEGSYRYWREEAGRHRKEAGEDASGTLAEQLKSELEEASPIEEASLFSDLLNAALGEVDWFEVADAFLEDVEPEDEDDHDSDAGDDDEKETETSNQGVEQVAPLFSLGRVVSTPEALAALTREDIDVALRRHVAGDWGEMHAGERLENEAAAREGYQVHSVYRSSAGCRFYVITEADRSVTTVLLPEEY